ncbi:unnamed protein product [Rotaria sordida]|uniref:Alpha-N-acetylglucosaminidase tim-barrel domain-containing protein n=1 Tax=Rotaria sordida TaxID=392033 RepID=A0A814ZDR5_9BILA|nr:unnamed protein product [Rotaria sordida]
MYVTLNPNHLILLDLFSEPVSQYSRFESFYGHYYIWNMLHDFGRNNSCETRSERSVELVDFAMRRYTGDHSIPSSVLYAWKFSLSEKSLW